MFDVRPARPVDPVHPAITPEAIATLVATFYARVRAEPRLGPIFEARLAGRWPEHLDRMVAFWRTVLLREAGYKGEPVQRHRAQQEVVSEDYRAWLALFRATVADVMPAEAAPAVIAAAERIAESLWLARFGNATTVPPAFLRGGA